MQDLTRKIAKKEWPQIRSLTVVNDDISTWRFELCNFDNSLEGGRNLNDDLQVSHASWYKMPYCISTFMLGTGMPMQT